MTSCWVGPLRTDQLGPLWSIGIKRPAQLGKFEESCVLELPVYLSHFSQLQSHSVSFLLWKVGILYPRSSTRVVGLKGPFVGSHLWESKQLRSLGLPQSHRESAEWWHLCHFCFRRRVQKKSHIVCPARIVLQWYYTMCLLWFAGFPFLDIPLWQRELN